MARASSGTEGNSGKPSFLPLLTYILFFTINDRQVLTAPINNMSLASKKGTSKRKRDGSPTRSDEYYDEDGDLEIVSSDNVLFRLHAFRFQASS
jgi:hypothetical protein